MIWFVRMLCALAIMLVAGPAFADDATATGVGGIIMTAIGIALSLAGAGWSLFVSHAAHSEAKWDDWTVARVRDLARTVIKEEQSGTSPIPPAPTPPAPK